MAISCPQYVALDEQKNNKQDLVPYPFTRICPTRDNSTQDLTESVVSVEPCLISLHRNP